ncbi:hypothetical protein ABIA32_003956 [Streptacidiphilus sp. MAP12-20]|uniref:hypothetical protein n=1 Tax=Streptacidiphilus sp. MAP12-20 TaxID=3156299 RepID=UPI0035182414
MKLRISAATALAAAAAVLAVGAAPAIAATPAVAKPTSLTLNASTTWAKYGQWVTLTAHLGKTAANRTVEIDVNAWGGGAWVAKKANVDRYGNLTAYAKMTRNSTFTAKFAGDSKDAAASTKRTVYSAAGVASWMVGYYGVSNGYHLYHFNTLANETGKPIVRGFVAPNKGGQSVGSTWQVYYRGAWYTVSNQGFQLSQYSTLGVWFSDDSRLNYLPERFSFNYGGDGYNTGAFSGWQYFKVTS